MLRIWGRANSTNVKKALWCAEELGVSYERIDAGGPFGRLNSPEFGVLNPNRKIPVLEDNGIIVWESNTVVRYLAARYGAGTLYPEYLEQRARCEQWMDWASINVMPLLGTVVIGLLRTPPEQRDHKAIEVARAGVAALLPIAEAELGRSPFLSGQEFGLGDIPLGCMIYPWLRLPIERPDLPNVQAWYERLLARPAYAGTVAIPLT